MPFQCGRAAADTGFWGRGGPRLGVPSFTSSSTSPRPPRLAPPSATAPAAGQENQGKESLMRGWHSAWNDLGLVYELKQNTARGSTSIRVIKTTFSSTETRVLAIIPWPSGVPLADKTPRRAWVRVHNLGPPPF